MCLSSSSNSLKAADPSRMSNKKTQEQPRTQDAACSLHNQKKKCTFRPLAVAAAAAVWPYRSEQA